MEQWISISLAVLSVILMVVGFLYRHKMKHLQKYGYLGIFMVSAIGNVAIMSPSAPLVAAAGGSLYNPFVVGALAALGAVTGQLLSYTIGSAAGGMSITDSYWYRTAHKHMETNGFLTVFLLACFPNPVIDAGGILSGATKYPMWKFLIASFFGKWVKYTVFAAVGKRFIRIK